MSCYSSERGFERLAKVIDLQFNIYFSFRRRQPAQRALKEIKGMRAGRVGACGGQNAERLPLRRQKRGGRNEEKFQKTLLFLIVFETAHSSPLFSVFGFVLLYLFHRTFCFTKRSGICQAIRRGVSGDCVCRTRTRFANTKKLEL